MDEKQRESIAETLCVVSDSMNSDMYTWVLKDALVPILEDVMDNQIIFHQDNASIHASKHTQDWFAARDITFLDGPAHSPNLNPIENLWAILARSFGEEGL